MAMGFPPATCRSSSPGSLQRTTWSTVPLSSLAVLALLGCWLPFWYLSCPPSPSALLPSWHWITQSCSWTMGLWPVARISTSFCLLATLWHPGSRSRFSSPSRMRRFVLLPHLTMVTVAEPGVTPCLPSLPPILCNPMGVVALSKEIRPATLFDLRACTKLRRWKPSGCASLDLKQTAWMQLRLLPLPLHRPRLPRTSAKRRPPRARARPPRARKAVARQ